MTRYDVEVWQDLMSPRCAALVAAAVALPMPDVASVSKLRAAWDAELVFAALELASARRKGEAKFGALIKAMAVDVEGVQMASSPTVAAWKARRIGETMKSDGGFVLDLCCGIGGDSMELARVVRVIAVDRDPARAWMAGLNAGLAGSAEPSRAGVQAVTHAGVIASATLDVAELASGEPVRLGNGRVVRDDEIAAIHLDPARRDDSGHRERGLDRLEPGPSVIAGLVRRFGTACVKLAPGTDASDLAEAGLLDAAGWGSASGGPSEAGGGRGRGGGGYGELEYISERGRLTQCVWWTGRFCGGGTDGAGTGAMGSSGGRRATMLDGPRAVTLFRGGLAATHVDEPPMVEGGTLRRYVATIDPSVERAGLLGALCQELGVAMAHPRVGLLTADRPIESAWVSNFEVLTEFAIGRGWSVRSRRDVKKWLDAHDGGIAEVKTRGKLVDTDEVQGELRGKGSTTHTVFVLLFGERVRVIVGRRG